MGFWSGLSGTAAEIRHGGHHYRVDLRLFSVGRNVTLHVDGRRVESASTPARFVVADGAVIEVDASEHGFNRALLRHHGETERLEPAAGTWEAARRRWGAAHPVASRLVAAAATVVVLASIVLLLMQLVAAVTSIARVRDLLGGWSFTMPFDPSPVLLVVIGLVVGAAALERALRMR